MCKFFSVISNGKGRILFFTLKDIQKIEKEENPENYYWNSHTSIAHYNGIKGEKEDSWNKWEYNPETKELKIDGEYNAKDDGKSVKKKIEKYLADNGGLYCLKVYNRNSGDRNSGNRNSGYRNSGNWNSGDWNSGDRNSGDWNSGNRNSGYLNTNEPKVRIFNKLTNKKNIDFPNYFYFNVNELITVSKMTAKEKKEFYWYKTTEGYLRTINYKEAWKKSFEQADKEDVAKTLKLPNFDYDLFEEITGITKKMITAKLKKKK